MPADTRFSCAAFKAAEGSAFYLALFLEWLTNVCAVGTAFILQELEKLKKKATISHREKVEVSFGRSCTAPLLRYNRCPTDSTNRPLQSAAAPCS